MPKNNEKRQGAVTVLVAVCLICLLGFVALAVDGGILFDRRQQVQAAADAAALAAAEELFARFRTNQGLDSGDTALQAALDNAQANGFANSDVTVNFMNQITATSPYTGLPGYVEVIINYKQRRYFSVLFGSQDIPISCRAVAQGRWAAIKVGIMVLDPTSSGSLTVTGSAVASVSGAPVIINSNSPTAGRTTTGGASAIAAEFDVTGVPGTSGNFIGTIYNGQLPTPDPLRYLPEPDTTAVTVQSSHQTHFANGDHSIQPGVYQNGISVSGQATLDMSPGIYYMVGGGFAFTGNGNLNASGVMIVNIPSSSSDVININGNGTINLSPMTTGIYTGISLWQRRDSNNTVSVTGNGGSSMSGTFYVAGGTLNVTGNGVGNVIGSQYISYDVVVNGNGAFTVQWNANQVGKFRSIALVE